MARAPMYLDGFRDASKRAVRHLHAEADSMNDPHARRFMNHAAFIVGVELKRVLKHMSDHDTQDDT